jgi:hypothetical protein
VQPRTNRATVAIVSIVDDIVTALSIDGQISIVRRDRSVLEWQDGPDLGTATGLLNAAGIACDGHSAVFRTAHRGDSIHVTLHRQVSVHTAVLTALRPDGAHPADPTLITLSPQGLQPHSPDEQIALAVITDRITQPDASPVALIAEARRLIHDLGGRQAMLDAAAAAAR